MNDLTSVAISGLVGMAMTFYFGMNYQEAVTDQNAIHLKTVPYSAEEEPELILSIVPGDELSGLINAGKATVETWRTTGKTVITITTEDQ